MRLVRLVAGLALALAVVVVLPVACLGDRDTSEVATPTSTTGPEAAGRIADAVVRIDATGRVQDVLPVPYGLEMRLVHGLLWVHRRSDGRLSQIDPMERQARVVDIGEVAGIATDGTHLWVSYGGNRIGRVDSVTGVVERSFRVARRKLFELGDAGFLAVTGDSIWLTVPQLGTQRPQELWRIDAATGGVLAKHPIGVDPTPPMVVDRFLWFVTVDDGFVRFDTVSGRYRAFSAGERPWGYTFGAGSVWVGNELAGEVRRLDPETGRTSAVIHTEPNVRGLGFGGGYAWVTTETSLQRIDPRTNRVTRATRITSPVRDEGPIGIAYLDGDVWVSVE